MKPTFSYYGSKWRVARVYPPPREGLPIVEPFAGGAGYAHWFDDGRRDVLLFDTSPHVSALWTWLLSSTPQDVLALPLLDGGRVPDGLPFGAQCLIGFFCGYALAKPREVLSPNVDWSLYPMKHWTDQSRAKVAENRKAMGDRWHFLAGGFSDAPDIEATWFIDPPYSNAAGKRYQQKITSYSDLAAWSINRKGRVIVCENEGANWMNFERATVQTGGNSRSKSIESIWVNEQWRLL